MRKDSGFVRAAIVILSILVLPLACGPSDSNSAADADTKFENIADFFLNESMALGPVGATFAGDHRFDGQLDQITAEARQRITGFYQATLDTLNGIERAQLSRANQVDYELLRNHAEYELFRLLDLQEWAWNPTVYTGLAGGAVYSLMAREFAPVEERLSHVADRLEQFPQMFEQIRAALDPGRVPKIHAETAVSQNRGVHSVLDNLVVPALASLGDNYPDRGRLETAMQLAREATDEHQKWLEGELLPNASGNFRIGPDLFDKKLAFTLHSPMLRAEILRRAEARMVEIHDQMYEIATGLLDNSVDPSASYDTKLDAIRRALEIVYRERPKRGQIVSTAEEFLEQTTEFVRTADLVTVPDDPVEIIVMPEFRRGVSLAYCDSPGPLDVGQRTFYAVSPLPADWTPEQDESFLREYNNMGVQVLTMHEAMPGHFLQIAHSNRYPSTLRAVLSSGVFIEGWAEYIEEMMVEAGYLDRDPKLHLATLKLYLRSLTNAIIDQKIHAGDMTRTQAMEYMVDKGFQQEREAAGKWVRAQLTSTQLSTYFVGYLGHIDLRRAVERREGEAFNLKVFHDRVLSFGAPPLPFVRALVLGEPIPGKRSSKES